MESLLYLGHDMNFWIELKKRAEELQVIDYLQEIADLKGKLDFTKSRIKQIEKVLGSE